MKDNTRLNEWFVPKFGPLKFRIFVGILFLPYTGMCISFAIWGSVLYAPTHWDRIASLCLIYLFGLGISAHAADGLGSKKMRPWASYFTRRQLLLIAILSLGVAYSIGIYYIIFYVPWLLFIAILEGFFLFAYNFELLNGFFHNAFWFSLSWGMLPVLAGSIMQTNSVSVTSLIISLCAGFISYLEIKLSRPYKELMRTKQNGRLVKKLENYLKSLSVGTVLFTVLALVLKLTF